MGELYHDDGYTDSDLLAEAVTATGKAYDEAREVYGHSNTRTLRTGLNHAAMLGMPLRDTDQGGAEVTRHYHGDSAGELLANLLTACPVDTMPAYASVIANNLGRYLCGTGRWAEACGVFRTALSAVELLYRAAPDAEAKLAELGSPTELSLSTLSGWLISAALQAEDYAGALAAIEETRAKLIADKLRLDVPSGQAGPQPADGHVLYLGVSALSCWVILVPPTGQVVFSISTLAASRLRPLVVALRGARTQDERSTAFAALADLLRPHITAPAYQMAAATGADDVAVVASGLLNGVGVHAMPATEDGACLLHLCAVRFIPSAGVARDIESRPPTGGGNAVAVADIGDLAFAKHEHELLTSAFNTVDVAPHSGDRKTWVLDAIPGSSHMLFSGHAEWWDHDPLRSPLKLGKQGDVVLAELLTLPDGVSDTVVLSGCETGVTIEVLADEVLGFGSAMLLAGARAAVITSWRQGDRMCALLLAAFYDEVARGTELATALRLGQLWLAQLTLADLVTVGEGGEAKGRRVRLPRRIASELAVMGLAAPHNPHDPFYADPVTWGGFSYFGVPVRIGGRADGAA